MTKKKIISDTELHAYLDGQLDEKQQHEVELTLQNDNVIAEKLLELQKMNQALHTEFNPVLQEDIPDRLLNATKPQHNWLPFVASVSLFILGTLVGWQAQVKFVPTAQGIDLSAMDDNLIKPAAFAHSIFTAELIHPVEIRAERHHYLNRWLSKRLKTQLTAPNLSNSGYTLIGGRLLPSTQNRMAAQYMYEDQQGSRITIYVRRGEWQQQTKPFEVNGKKGYSIYYWIDEDLGYVLTSGLDKNKNRVLANEAYKQMSLRPVKI